MKTTTRGSLLRNAGSVCLVLFALSQGLAQSQAPADTRSLVRITQVKPDMVTEWLAIQKNEVNPALKKGGVASRTLLETVLGNQYEYVSITPMGSYSEMDADNPLIKALGKDGGAKLLTKIRKCIDGQTMFVSTRLAELSSVPKNSAAIWTTVRYRAAPGKNQDYENYLKTDLLPVYAKATAVGKIAGYSVSRRGPGATTRDRTLVIYSDKIASMEAGTVTVQMLGQEGSAKLIAKSGSLASLVEVLVRRRLSDVSY